MGQSSPGRPRYKQTDIWETPRASGKQLSGRVFRSQTTMLAVVTGFRSVFPRARSAHISESCPRASPAPCPAARRSAPLADRAPCRSAPGSTPGSSSGDGTMDEWDACDRLPQRQFVNFVVGSPVNHPGDVVEDPIPKRIAHCRRCAAAELGEIVQLPGRRPVLPGRRG